MSVHTEISLLGIPEVGEKQWPEKEKKKEQKSVLSPPRVAHTNHLDQFDSIYFIWYLLWNTAYEIPNKFWQVSTNSLGGAVMCTS